MVENSKWRIVRGGKTHTTTPIENPHTVPIQPEWADWLKQQIAYTVSGGTIMIPSAGVSYEIVHETKTAKVAPFMEQPDSADRIITERIFRQLGWEIIEVERVRSAIEYEGKDRLAMIDTTFIDEFEQFRPRRRTP